MEGYKFLFTIARGKEKPTELGGATNYASTLSNTFPFFHLKKKSEIGQNVNICSSGVKVMRCLLWSPCHSNVSEILPQLFKRKKGSKTLNLMKIPPRIYLIHLAA